MMRISSSLTRHVRRAWRVTSFVFGLSVFFIERPDEHEICELFDDGQGVRDAARPDVRPDFINLILDLACYHGSLL